MCASNVEVIADDRHGVDEVVEERFACLSPLATGDVDAHAEFSDRDRRDCGLVVVLDQHVQIEC